MPDLKVLIIGQWREHTQSAYQKQHTGNTTTRFVNQNFSLGQTLIKIHLTSRMSPLTPYRALPAKQGERVMAKHRFKTLRHSRSVGQGTENYDTWGRVPAGLLCTLFNETVPTTGYACIWEVAVANSRDNPDICPVEIRKTHTHKQSWIWWNHGDDNLCVRKSVDIYLKMKAVGSS